MKIPENPVHKGIVDWAFVDDFGAVGDGKTDSTNAIQAAMNSGKSVVLIMTVLFFVISLVRKGKEKDNLKIKKPAIIIVMVTGTLNGAVNLINLYLSGHMASIIFFPIVNGGVIILAALAALIVFHERPNKRQAWGMIIGLASVLLLGIG